MGRQRLGYSGAEAIGGARTTPMAAFTWEPYYNVGAQPHTSHRRINERGMPCCSSLVAIRFVRRKF
jgi:hypothetical protein